MEIRHLKYFLLLAEELNFRRASEKLFIAQPALSRQIQQLENELGVKLFHRTKRKVKLLPTGELLKEETLRLLGQIENLKTRLNLIHTGLVGELKIGYVGSAMHSILPQLLLKYKNSYPAVILKLHEWTSMQQIEAVQKNELDIAFVRSKAPMSDLHFRSCYRENLALVLPSYHKINKKNFKTLKEVANENFILFPRQSGIEYYDKIIGICNKAGFSPKIAHETVFGTTTIKLIEAGLGVSILPASLEEKSANVTFITLPNLVDLYVCYLKNAKKSMLANFIHMIK